MLNADKYTYHVTWSEEDQEFVGLCAEFPGLSWLEEKQDEAFNGIRKLVADVLQDMENNNEKIPVPLALHSFSGKFMTRILPEQHRNLVTEVVEQDINLSGWCLKD
ncbi:MAG: toxin-antitoxin system HicB family antitoxin [bacterium]|nr:toxin-antitoxin system HicB family antitoxin [bacterium]